MSISSGKEAEAVFVQFRKFVHPNFGNVSHFSMMKVQIREKTMFGLIALIAAIGLSASSTAFCTVQESHPQDFNFVSTIDPCPYISRSEMMGMLGMISSPAFTGGGIKVGITENAPSLYADAICMPADELGAEAVPSASGSKNAGRVGIGDIVFLEAEEEFGYWLANHEPIVVRGTFWKGAAK